MKIYMVLLLIASVCLAAPAASQEAPTDTARQHRVDKFLQKDPNPGDGQKPKLLARAAEAPAP